MKPRTIERDPIAELRLQGAEVHRSSKTRSTALNVGGVVIELSQTHIITSKWTLPQGTGIHATFSASGLLKWLLMWFHRTIKSGDDAFDDAIFVRTKTDDATHRLLAASAVRQAIQCAAQMRGTVRIRDTTVVIVTKDTGDYLSLPPELEARLVGALLV